MPLRMKMLSLTMSIILDEYVCYLSTIFKAWEDDFLCWVETSLRLFRIGSRLWSRNHELLLQTRLCSLQTSLPSTFRFWDRCLTNGESECLPSWDNSFSWIATVIVSARCSFLEFGDAFAPSVRWRFRLLLNPADLSPFWIQVSGRSGTTNYLAVVASGFLHHFIDLNFIGFHGSLLSLSCPRGTRQVESESNDKSVLAIVGHLGTAYCQ